MCAAWKGLCSGQGLQKKKMTARVRVHTSVKHALNSNRYTVCNQFLVLKYDQNIFNLKLVTCQEYAHIYTSNEKSERRFFLFILVWFACISYGRLIAIHYKFNLSTYVQELLVIGGKSCMGRDLNEEM
jgi:hypothetical protein